MTIQCITIIFCLKTLNTSFVVLNSILYWTVFQNVFFSFIFQHEDDTHVDVCDRRGSMQSPVSRPQCQGWMLKPAPRCPQDGPRRGHHQTGHCPPPDDRVQRLQEPRVKFYLQRWPEVEKLPRRWIPVTRPSEIVIFVQKSACLEVCCLYTYICIPGSLLPLYRYLHTWQFVTFIRACSHFILLASNVLTRICELLIPFHLLHKHYLARKNEELDEERRT